MTQGKKRKEPPAETVEPATDKHRPRKMTSIRERFVGPVTEAADRLGMDVTEWVNQAVREKLEREGLWPPKGEPAD